MSISTLDPEGLTFAEWSMPYSEWARTTEPRRIRAAWRNGENPTEWKVSC